MDDFKRRDFMRMITAAGVATIIPQTAHTAETGSKIAKSSSGGKRGKRPNIVCFIADDTDFTMLSCFGGPVPTPHIDSIASKGIVFSNAQVASPICTPSRYSFLTGQFAGRCTDTVFLHECPYNEPCMVEHNVYLNETVPTLGSTLKKAGYRTGFVGKWHTGHGIPMLPLPKINLDADPSDLGVKRKLEETQTYFDERVKKDAGFDYAGAIVWGNCDFYPLRPQRTHHLEWSAHTALNFLDTCKNDQPFFLWFASTIIHGPGIHDALAKDPKLTPVGHETAHLKVMPSRQSVADRVKAAGFELTHESVGSIWLDDQVGAILEKIKKMGQEENTIFVFASDNNVEPAKGTCHRAGTNIPFIVKYPALIKEPKTCGVAIQNTDLLPTLLECAGAAPMAVDSIDGKSFYPMLKNSSAPKLHDDLYFEMGYTRAIEADGWKYIAFRLPPRLQEQVKRGELKMAPNYNNRPKHEQSILASIIFEDYFDADQLYDLGSDPGETKNLARSPECQAKLAEMKTRLKKRLETFRHPFDLEDTVFMNSPEFAKAAEATRAFAKENVPEWWPKKMYKRSAEGVIKGG